MPAVSSPTASPSADRVDIVTGTVGKALGGASGRIRQRPGRDRRAAAARPRPYLFSSSVAPIVVAGSLTARDLVAGSREQRKALRRNTALFRAP